MSHAKRAGTSSAAAVAAVQGLALVALVVAWSGASHEVRLSDQWAWGGLAAGALALSAVGHSLVIITLRRRIAHAAGRVAGHE